MGKAGQDVESRRASLRARFVEWTPYTFDGWLDRCAQEYGDRPLVITDERTLTYVETAEWSRRLADGLAALGVRPGDHVGMIMANYLEFVPLKFAIARVGAVAVPFNFLYRRNELAYVLAQSECRLVITMTGFGDLDYLGMLDEIAPGWDSGTQSALPDLRTVVQLSTDGRERDGVLTVEQLGARGTPGGSDGMSARPDDPGDILYTSGSTGSPKGVLVTHDAVLRTSYASALTRAYEDGRRILFSLPCYHMFGYIEGLLSATFVGGAIIPLTSFSPVGYFEGIARHQATDILCVPTMTVALLEHPDREKYDFSSLTGMLSGAAPAPVWLWQQVEKAFGISEIVTGYGMTECGGAMTLTLPEDPLELTATTAGRPKYAGSAGLPLPGDGALVAYNAVDPLTGDDMPEGEVGELVSRGPTTMLKYWNKPEETSEALRDGWLHSGDLGIVRPDGYLEVTGRTKELYKSGGELVMPREIEELLSAQDGISQVYLVGIRDDRWGETGCACVVRSPGSTITEATVINICKENLARFKVPKKVLFFEADQLPTTPTGKIQKYLLVERAEQIARGVSS